MKLRSGTVSPPPPRETGSATPTPLENQNCAARNAPNNANNNDSVNDNNEHAHLLASSNNHQDNHMHFPTPISNGHGHGVQDAVAGDTTLQHPENALPMTLRPHNKWVILLMKSLTAILVFLYFVAPIIMRLNPWILTEVTFLHRVTWPPFLNMDRPENFGLNYTRSFKIRTSDDVTLGAWHILPKDLETEPRPSDDRFTHLLTSGHPLIIYFHGNAGTRGGWHRVRLYRILSSLGFHVISFDYRGYADSTGSPSEEGVFHDGVSVYKWAVERGASSVYFWGHSLGTAIATKVAREICQQGLPLTGLILEAPFNNIIDAYHLHPLSKPFVLLPWYTWAVIEGLKTTEIYFTTDISISDVTVRTLILHAQDDGIVPYKLGQKLFRFAQKNKPVGSVQFIGFDSSRRFGHKHIHKAPELPDIIRKFVLGKD